MTDSMRFVWRRLVVRDADLTDATRRVLLDLESYANADGTNARPGIKRIAEGLRTPDGKHVSERTVRRALEKGVTRGFIDISAKAPRGRGNKRADEYRLTFPVELVGAPEEIVDTQVSGISEDDAGTDTNPVLADAQMSTNTGVNSGHLGVNSGHSDPYEWTSECPTTSPLPPDQISPGKKLSSYVSNAGASVSGREEEKAAQAEEPPSLANSFDGYGNVRQPEPEQTPMDHLRRTLGALSEDETIYAEDMLELNCSWYAIRAEIDKSRNRRIGRRNHLHPIKDTSGPLNGAEIPTATAEMSTPL